MTDVELLSGVYGAPPPHLADTPRGARQLSPLHPGASDLGAAPPGSYASIVMLAPPGTLERRYAMAQALTALAHGAEFTAIAPKDKGGARMKTELEDFSCTVAETSKSHHRLCVVQRPETLTGVDEALSAGAPRFVEETGLWSQPGVFSWDRIDPGSILLVSRLPQFKGHGADLGCGLGFLAHGVLRSPAVERLELIDIDRRAIEAAKRNVMDPRAHLHWADATGGDPHLSKLDFVVMNPPFHSGASEDKALGQAFIRNAARMLRPGGVCWLVANRHLPYEAVLAAAFKSVRLDHDAGGFKIYEAKA
ncbi:MAG: class I SAM-dependent methyltransferase [Alphaproteobacteria bacterium]|nr:class I SAM-dependent methyltransferase [Alphaproteobacteria bacterium]